MNIKEITKNYYQVRTNGLCSVLVDNKLMKKVVKLEQEFGVKIKKLLNDNKEHCVNHTWGLCFPNGKQIPFYAINTEYCNQESLEKMINCVHQTRVTKIDLLFDLDGKSAHNEEVRKYLSNYLSERIFKEEQ